MATDITSILQELDSIDSSYDRRRKIENLAKDSLFTIAVVASEVDRNYSYVREDGYRDGYSILGSVNSVSSAVKILLPTALNEQATNWSAGDSISLVVKVYDWDSAYKHFKLLATEVASDTTPSPPATSTPPEVTPPSPAKVETPTPAEPTSTTPVPSKAPSPPTATPPTPPKQPVGESTQTTELRPESARKPAPEPEAKPAPNLKKVERPKAKRSRAKPQTPKATRASEQNSTNQQQANTTQAQPPVKPQAQPTAYNKTPVSLKQYNPPTLKGVPTRRNTPTFGGRTKPMQPLMQSQRFTSAPTNPFEIVQGQYKKPLILGLKIFGGIFAGFLLLICVCCGLLSS